MGQTPSSENENPRNECLEKIHRLIERGKLLGDSTKTGGDVNYRKKFFEGNSSIKSTPELREYAESLSAKMKKELIRGLGHSLNTLGFKSIDPDADPDAIIEEIKKRIPSPRQNDQAFSVEAEENEEVCRDIAEVFNKYFSPEATEPNDLFIDTSLGPVAVCRAVAEWAHTFTSGLNTEFLAVHAGIRNTMNNLQNIDHIMASAYDLMHAQIRADPRLDGNLDKLDHLYVKARQERRRQEHLLRNLLHVSLVPAESELELAIDSISNDLALVRDLGNRSPQEDFNRALTSAIYSLNTSAFVARSIHNALQKVGLSVQQYLDSPEYKDFEKLLDENFEKNSSSTEEAVRFLGAVEDLRRNFDNRRDPDIIKNLKDIQSVNPNAFGTASRKKRAEGGLELNLDRRVAEQKLTKQILVKDFVNRMTRHYDELLASIEAMGPQLGREIVLSSKTDALRDALSRLRDLRETRIELALVGLYDDSEAREKKESFLTALKFVSTTLEDILESDMYRSSQKYFKRLKNAIDSLKDTIDKYTDILVKKFGGKRGQRRTDTKWGSRHSESLEDSKDDSKEQNYSEKYNKLDHEMERGTSDEVEHRAEHGTEHGTERGVEQKASYGASRELEHDWGHELDHGLGRKLDHRARRGSGYGSASEKNKPRKKNQYGGVHDDEIIHETSEEFQEISEPIEDQKKGGVMDGIDSILPEISRSSLNLNEAVGMFQYFYYVAKVHSNLKKTAADLDDYKDKYESLLGDAVAARIYALKQEQIASLDRLNQRYPDSQAFPGGESTFSATKKWITDEYDVKIRFYDAVQAIDIYLMVFTRAIAGDPDSMRDIKKILSDLEVITRWSNEHMGESLWKAFEYMPSTDFGGNKIEPNATAGAQILTDIYANHPHYYDKIGARGAAASRLGIPELGVHADQGDRAKKFVIETLDYFQALKNLINAFARIGGKFGGIEIRKHREIFMQPTQIFKALMDYLKGSAMSINANPSADPVNIQFPVSERGPPFRRIDDAIGPYQVYFGSTMPGMGGRFEVEDKYFILLVKAMAAKILTALGVYDMLERRSPIYDLTPTRMIVGGAPMETVPVILSGATELYFRLPRLAEFYRSFLCWDGGVQQYRIAMLPELEGVFSGLIRFIFQKASSSESGDYSVSEIGILISEINNIYNFFYKQSETNATERALEAFVKEINRRYGIIKGEDMRQYWTLLQRIRRDKWGAVNDTNYAILPGEGETDLERMAPSDRFLLPQLSLGVAPSQPYLGRTQLDTSFAIGQHRELLRRFRSDLEKEFARVPRDQFGKTSYSLLIKHTTSDLNTTTDPSRRFEIITRLIQGAQSISTDSTKSLLFHETVMTGLNILSALQIIISRFGREIDFINPLKVSNAIMDTIYNRAITLDADLPEFGKTRLTGGAFLGDIEYKKYILSGTSSDPINGVSLFLRAGIPLNITSGHLYVFMLKEINYLRTHPDAHLAAPPSSYSNEEAPGLPPSQLRTLRALRMFSRFIVDSNLMMKDYVENVFDIISRPLDFVEVRFPQIPTSPIQISFERLRAFMIDLIADIKHYIDVFRPFLPKEVISRFEDRQNPGSISWLDDLVIDVLVKGRTDDSNDQKNTFDGIARRTTDTLVALLRDTFVHVDPTQFSVANLSSNDEATRAAIFTPPLNMSQNIINSRYESYGRAFSQMIYYDALLPNSGYNDGIAVSLNIGYPLSDLVQESPGERGEPTRRINIDDGAATPQRLKIYNDLNGITMARGLMLSFNQLLARYLSVFTDIGIGRKIYNNLIQGFVNGIASTSISVPKGQSFPDIVAQNESFGQRGDPKANAFLLQSTAFVLQRLAFDSTAQGSTHLLMDVNLVSPYIKERYRAYLPTFEKAFRIISQKAEFLNQFISKTNVRLDRPSQRAILGAGPGVKIRVGRVDRNRESPIYPDNSFNALEPLDAGKNSDTMRIYLKGLLASIQNGAYILSSSSTEVLREINDIPKLFELQNNGNEMYERQYGKPPLTPFSLVLYYLNDLEPLPEIGENAPMDDKKLFPAFRQGEPQFKLLYGSRVVFVSSNQVGYEQMPGIKKLLDSYNDTSPPRERIDANQYLVFVNKLIQSLRYITDMRNIKSLFSTSRLNFSTDSLLMDTGIVLGDPATRNAVYSIGDDILDVVSVVENQNQNEEMEKIVSIIGAEVRYSTANRQLERIHNLIDMNIIPINVHALMRDIPLANLYNYEYTFEEMAAGIYGEMATRYANELDPSFISNDRIRNTRQLFLRLLVDPYLDLDKPNPIADSPGVLGPLGIKLYGSDVRDLGSAGFIHRIFRGDNNLRMGRPKYLSDQVFNKALLGSIYQAQSDFDEAGPGSGAGIARGHANVTENTRPVYSARDILSALRYKISLLSARLLAMGNRDDWTMERVANVIAENPGIDDLIFNPGMFQTILDFGGDIERIQRLAERGGVGNATLTSIERIRNVFMEDVYDPLVALRDYGPTRTTEGNYNRIVGLALLQLTERGELMGYINALLGDGPDSLSVIAESESADTEIPVYPATEVPWSHSSGRRSRVITYMRTEENDRAPESAVKEVVLDSSRTKDKLEIIGQLRFNTRFIRNMFFIVNVLRLVRLKLNRDLTQTRHVLANSHTAVAPGITEYGFDPYDPNEVLESLYLGSLARFSDKDPF